MKTFKRKCLKSFEAEYGDSIQGKYTFKVEEGKTYFTSNDINGYVLVFTDRWFISFTSLFDEGEEVS